MAEVYAALAGAIAAGVFALVGVGVGYLLEERRAIRQQIARDAEWIRDNLFRTYSDCIYYLVKLALSSTERSASDKDVRQHYSEALRFLNLLIGFHFGTPDVVQQLESAATSLANTSDKFGGELSKAADDAVAQVKLVFRADRRIQGCDPRN
jgi:hypothetical protein